MEKEECARPQQPDGISNIRSWNVRNAGQSDPTEREEGGEERQVRRDTKRREMRKSGAAKESGVNTARLCECKDTESLFVEGVARYGTNNFIQLEVVAAIVELCVCVARGLVLNVLLPDFIQTNPAEERVCSLCGGGGW